MESTAGSPLTGNKEDTVSINRIKPPPENIALSSTHVYTRDDGKLNPAQRKFYEENGFIIIRNLVSKEKLKKYEQRFKDIANLKVKIPGLLVQKDISFKDEPRNENTVYKLQDLFLDEELFDYCKDHKILDYVEAFTGKNIMAIHTMLINKPPDAGTMTSRHPLHQDLHYFPIRPANPIVCAWTAMEKVNRENGCLVALPGSHKGRCYFETSNL
jgi:phytanoyl-CoA hydroxylase